MDEFARRVEMLRRLSDIQIEVLRLRCDDAKPYKEIAKQLHMSESNIYYHIGRIHQALELDDSSLSAMQRAIELRKFCEALVQLSQDAALPIPQPDVESPTLQQTFQIVQADETAIVEQQGIDALYNQQASLPVPATPRRNAIPWFMLLAALGIAISLIIANRLVQPTPNLVLNNGFEDGMESWEVSELRFAESYLTAGTAGDGFCSKQLTGGNEKIEWVGTSQRFAIDGGNPYDFASWLKWEEVTQFHVKVEWWDDSGPLNEEERIMDAINGTSDGWVLKRDSLQAPPDATQARLVFWHGVSGEVNIPGGVICVDDVVWREHNSGFSFLPN